MGTTAPGLVRTLAITDIPGKRTIFRDWRGLQSYGRNEQMRRMSTLVKTV